MYDVIVIGGGAAGMMAAGTAAECGAKVLVVEKKDKPLRKVCITGKGRCNITNTRPREEFLQHVRANSEFFESSFDRFNNRATVDFFKQLGVELTIERGDRVFPASGKAWDIVDALVLWNRRLGVETMCGCRVTDILTRFGRACGVKLFDENGAVKTVDARRVILATGGVSYPNTGSTGDGYEIAHRLGHNIESLRPSLVALESNHPAISKLAGLQLKNVSLKLMVDDEQVSQEFGEMEFAVGREEGFKGKKVNPNPNNERRRVEIAGAIILRISRDAVDAVIDKKRVVLDIDIKPALTLETLQNRIHADIAELGSKDVQQLVRKLVPFQMVIPVIKEVEFRADKQEIGLDDPMFVPTLASLLKSFTLNVTGYRPFEEAVVTAGGIDVSQVNGQTLESLLVRGLYFAGELLDVDADTGGYNLQIAFSMGRLAGMSVAK